MKFSIKKIFTGDPYARQKAYEKMAQKEAKRQREIQAGLDSYKYHRFGNKKLGKSDLAELKKFKKTLMAPPKKKSIDSVINDFIPNPDKVGVVDVSFGKSKRSSSLDDLASF